MGNRPGRFCSLNQLVSLAGAVAQEGLGWQPLPVGAAIAVTSERDWQLWDGGDCSRPIFT